MFKKNLISVSDLTLLLQDIFDHRPDISIRFRMLGEMWNNSFYFIAFVRGKSAILREERSGTLVTIQDLSNVMQFELDHSFSGFQAHFHYDVKPLPDMAPSPTVS